MLSGPVQYQGKAGFLKLNFQFSNSRNTGKCKLGRFCSNSHIAMDLQFFNFIYSQIQPYSYAVIINVLHCTDGNLERIYIIIEVHFQRSAF